MAIYIPKFILKQGEAPTEVIGASLEEVGGNSFFYRCFESSQISTESSPTATRRMFLASETFISLSKFVSQASFSIAVGFSRPTANRSAILASPTDGAVPFAVTTPGITATVILLQLSQIRSPSASM